MSKKIDYSYVGNANLVLKADRSLVEKRTDATGEVESLYGKINPKEFGTRIERSKVLKTKNPKPKKKDDSLSILQNSHGQYKPKYKATLEIYELMLSLLSKLLGDVEQDVLYSASDSILEILKNENLKDLDKKQQLQAIVKVIIDNRLTMPNLQIYYSYPNAW